ncbi:MAG: helix-turn-helix domain-containing protein [Chloroflexota bacterium]
MRWNDIHTLPCSMARTLSVIGDRWTMLIIRDCFLGTRRFDDFQKQLGLTRHLLADRLNKLVEADVLYKAPQREGSTRYEYRLTEKGIELYPILLAMVAWGDRWMAGENGPPLEYIHRPCGQKTTPAAICSHCSEPIDPRAMQPIIGPGLKPYLDEPSLAEAKRLASYRFLTQGDSS